MDHVRGEGLLQILAASGFYSGSIFHGRCAAQIGCDELGRPDMECMCKCQVEADIDIDPQVETVGEHEHHEGGGSTPVCCCYLVTMATTSVLAGR